MRAESPETTRQAERETGRVDAFSDGVFAIAITLLVLTLSVPHVGSGGLWQALLVKGASYLAYVVSFLFILIMWINHHNMFRVIRRTNQGLLLLNGLLLMCVTLVPFPTSLLAQYHTGSDGTVATAVYSGLFVLTALAFNVLWLYISRRPMLLAVRTDSALMRSITRRYRFGPALYLVAFLLAFVSVPASLALNGALALFFALPHQANAGIGERA